LEQAVKNQILARNPAKGAVLPRQEHREKRVLTENETAVLLREAGERLYIPILLSLYTGMRRGEVLALTWARVQGNRITVTQSVEEGGAARFKAPKTKGSRRSITIPDFLMEELKAHKKMQDGSRLRAGSLWAGLDLVCPDERGRIQNPNTFTGEVSKLMRACGIDGATFHSLRHTHATQLMGMGFHPKVVQERLGHANIGITLDTYSHVSSGMQEEVARALGGVSNPVAVSARI
jgi:integrase